MMDNDNLLLIIIVVELVVIVVQAVINGRSIPAASVNQIIDRVADIAPRTETKIDDSFVSAAPLIVSVLQGLGVIGNGTAPSPLPPTPAPTPQPIIPTELPHATIPIVNSGRVVKIDDREIWQPEHFDYDGVPRDGNGDMRKHINVHFGNEPGARLNLDSIAGMFDFTLNDSVIIPAGQPFAAWIKYVGKIEANTGSVSGPLDEWAHWQLWIDGKNVSSATLASGEQHAVFNFIGTGQPQRLTFRLHLKWAGFHNDSVLTWLEAGYAHSVGEGIA